MYVSQVIALLFAATTTIALPITSGSISNQARAGLEIGDDMLVKRGFLKNAANKVGGAVKKTAGAVGKAAGAVGKAAGKVGKVASVVGKGAGAVGKVANKIAGKK
jgi:phage-related tail protein